MMDHTQHHEYGQQPNPHQPKSEIADAPSQTSAVESSVLSVVEQVEQQLRLLREAQQSQDEKLAQLSDRFSRLQQAESTVDEVHRAPEQQQAINAERNAIEDERRIMLAEREQWERSFQGREADLARHWEMFKQHEQANGHRAGEVEEDAAIIAGREQWNKSFEGREADLARHEEILKRREEELSRRAEDIEQQLADVAERERCASEQASQWDAERNELLQRLEQAERNVGELVQQLETHQNSLEERDARLAESDRQRESSEAELNTARQQAHALETERDAARAEIASLRAELEQHANATSSLQEYQQRISELEADIAASREKLAELERHRDERIAELEAQLENMQSNHASAANADEAVLQSLRDRIEELERQLEVAQQQAASSNQAKADQREVYAEELRAIDKQMQRLNEAKESLAAMERKMQRRWARPRAIVTVGWVFLLIIANIAASWMLVGQVVPPERAAQVILEPRTQSGEPLSSEQIERWQQWHKAMLADEGFHRTLASRFDERRIDRVNNASAVRELLTEHLSFSPNLSGSFTLTLAGTDRKALVPMLDVIAATLSAESHRRVGARGDGAWATARGEAVRPGSDEYQYALLIPLPINDQRMIWIGPILALMMTASGTLIWLIYRRLILAKRVFDEQCNTV